MGNIRTPQLLVRRLVVDLLRSALPLAICVCSKKPTKHTKALGSGFSPNDDAEKSCFGQGQFQTSADCSARPEDRRTYGDPFAVGKSCPELELVLLAGNALPGN